MRVEEEEEEIYWGWWWPKKERKENSASSYWTTMEGRKEGRAPLFHFCCGIDESAQSGGRVDKKGGMKASLGGIHKALADSSGEEGFLQI